MNIPSDFESHWQFSDVVLLAEDAEGQERELHAVKSYLGMFSSFFERLFFSHFQEANSERVKISCKYETLNLILQIIHGLCRDFTTVKVYEPSELIELYAAADFLDFPAVRKMCLKQMLERPSVEMASAMVRITPTDELHDALIENLKKLQPDDLNKVLSIKDAHMLFSKNDVKLIYELISKKKLPRPPTVYSRFYCRRTLPDLADNVENLVTDCTKKWPRSDVLFRTKNGKELFSNKTVLAMVSSHFANVFFGSPKSSNAPDFTEIEVNVDYMVMKNMLSIIHQSWNTSNLAFFVASNEFHLYNLFRAAEEFDIPNIKTICVEGMLVNVSCKRCETALKLNLTNRDRSKIFEGMKVSELQQWLCSGSSEVSSDYFYIDDGKYKANYTNASKQILYASEVGMMVETLLKEFNK